MKKSLGKMRREQPLRRYQGVTLPAIVDKLAAGDAVSNITMLSAGEQRAESLSHVTRVQEGLSLFKRLIGQNIADKYCVTRIIKIGGMGLVVAARHQYLNKVVAIKFLLPSLTENSEHLARFIREAQATAQLKSDHVARVMDVGMLPDGAPFVVMEYLEGFDLNELLQREGKLSAPLAVDIVLQVTEAMREVHSQGMVHRDLKPSNIFLIPRSSGLYKVKVIDFGIVKDKQPSHEESVLTRTGHLLGTPVYMPPEQLRGGELVDLRADIWALGVVLYECLSGERPFDGHSLASLVINILQEEPVRLERLQPDLPLGLDEVVHRCLQKDPAARYQSIEQLRSVLLDFAVYESTAILRARRARSMHELAAPRVPALDGVVDASELAHESKPSVPAPEFVVAELSLTGVHRIVGARGAESLSEPTCHYQKSVTVSVDEDVRASDATLIDEEEDIFECTTRRMPSLPPVTSSPRVVHESRLKRALSVSGVCFAGAVLMAMLSFPQLASSTLTSRPAAQAAANLSAVIDRDVTPPQVPEPQPSMLTDQARKPAVLRISTHPMPDRIYVDGRLWRGSIGQVTVTPDVSHKIVLVKAGHDAAYVRITLAAAERRALKLALPRSATPSAITSARVLERSPRR